MDALLLRFDAPLMSFGGPIVDNRGVIQDHPTLSMVVGLLGNALGYDHRDSDALQSLQRRLRMAARCDRPGERLTDFQTVDLGQDFLVDTGWTTRGAVERRAGGSAREATHIRTRQYLADAVYTVAVTLDPPDSAPTLDALAVALDAPERPLFLGRKPCIPATRLLLGRVSAPSLRGALRRRYAPVDPARDADPISAIGWWPAEEGNEGGALVAVTDERDWTNQIHGGRRLVRHGPIDIEEPDHAEG